MGTFGCQPLDVRVKICDKMKLDTLQGVEIFTEWTNKNLNCVSSY